MPTSKIPSRTSTPERWSALSSVNPGGLPVPVHAGGEPRVLDGELRVLDGELDSQPDGLDHALNPLESSSHSSETKSRRRWKQVRENSGRNIVLQSKDEGMCV